MRRRSGAIHCDTIQEYLQMAQVAQNQQGIFYDEKANQKMRNHFNTKMTGTIEGISTAFSNPQDLAIKRQQFADFQYNSQSEELKEQRQELQRASELQTINLAFLSASTADGYVWLRNHLALSEKKAAGELYLDVQVIKKGKIIFKCWIFKKDQLGFSPLLQIYLNRCQVVYQIDQKNQTLSTLSCRSPELRLKTQKLLFSK